MMEVNKRQSINLRMTNNQVDHIYLLIKMHGKEGNIIFMRHNFVWSLCDLWVK